MPTSLDIYWKSFILDLASREPEAYVQIRKMFRDVSFEVPYPEFDGVSLKPENLGYAAGDSKIRQLKRNYLDEGELIAARESLKKRLAKHQSCITARFGNQKKDSRSQGFCMQTISLNYISKPEEGKPQFVVELYYRSTEVGQKFYADLMFLYEVVFPLLLEGLPEPDLIRFRFSSLYMSSMFLPIFFQVGGVEEFINVLLKHDRKWYSRAVRSAIEKWMKPGHNYTYRSRVKMHELFRDYVYPKLSEQEVKRINKLMEK